MKTFVACLQVISDLTRKNLPPVTGMPKKIPSCQTKWSLWEYLPSLLLTSDICSASQRHPLELLSVKYGQVWSLPCLLTYGRSIFWGAVLPLVISKTFKVLEVSFQSHSKPFLVPSLVRSPDEKIHLEIHTYRKSGFDVCGRNLIIQGVLSLGFMYILFPAK